MKCWKQEPGDPWVDNQQVRSVIEDDDMDSDTRHRIRPFVKVTVILAQGE